MNIIRMLFVECDSEFSVLKTLSIPFHREKHINWNKKPFLLCRWRIFVSVWIVDKNNLCSDDTVDTTEFWNSKLGGILVSTGVRIVELNTDAEFSIGYTWNEEGYILLSRSWTVGKPVLEEYCW